MTVDDLSLPGWRVYADAPAASSAVVDGEVVPTSRIDGVLTRLPAVTEAEVRRIATEDRAYAATEMSAFLGYWLSTLSCTILNPPTASTLCGPGWRREKWILVASGLGIPVEAERRRSPPFDAASTSSQDRALAPQARDELVRVTLVGDSCLGTDDRVATRRARELAAAAEADLLTVTFAKRGSERVLLDAHPWMHMFDAETADAVLAHFEAGPATRLVGEAS